MRGVGRFYGSQARLAVSLLMHHSMNAKAGMRRMAYTVLRWLFPAMQNQGNGKLVGIYYGMPMGILLAKQEVKQSLTWKA